MLATTTSYAAVVRPLQVLVMVVAILFFARVLRVATVESRPVVGTTKERRKRAGLALEFIEPLEWANERVAVDPALIGGVAIRVGDILVDASVRRQLREMRQAMLNTPVASTLWAS